MTRLTVAVAPPYDVTVAEGALDGARDLLAGRRRVVVVTQAAVAEHWLAPLRQAIDAPSDVLLMGDGEEHKTLETVTTLCRGFASSGLLRDDAVAALGGGVVGDTAGFAAAVFHRGVAVVQVPTTLLAMVDSAIGGKTAVNLPEGKNLVGAFHQPIGVLADTRTLTTLPERELRCGLGEVAKYALMTDPASDPTGLVDLLEQHCDAVLARDPDTLADLVARCVAVKADVVARDPQEHTGLRATLNLGHTLAHALELTTGLTHGEAVAVGLVFAGELAGATERIPPDAVARFRALPARLGLPTAVPGGDDVDPDALLALMRRDKKAHGGLTFVLPGPRGIERVDDPPAPALQHAFRAVGVRG